MTGRSILQRNPTVCVVSKCVWSRMLNNEAAGTRTGPLRHSKKRKGIRCAEEQYENLLYFSVFATYLSMSFYTIIFYAVFRRLGAMYTFRSIILIYCTKFTGTI